MAGTTGSGGGRRGGMIAGINITPLCDILLVLLIIFMVASTYIVSQAIKVELPKAKASDGTSQGPTVLMLLRNGEVRWNGELVPEDKVEGALRGALQDNPEAELVVSADEQVMHGRVVHFIDLAKVVGIKRFAINVQKSE